MNFDLRPQPLAISIGPSSFRVDETMKRNSGNVEVENESCNLHRTTGKIGLFGIFVNICL